MRRGVRKHCSSLDFEMIRIIALEDITGSDIIQMDNPQRLAMRSGDDCLSHSDDKCNGLD